MAEIHNLYEQTTFFRLRTSSGFYQIDEPIGWDGVLIKMPRDPDTFGFLYEFVEDERTFRFPRNQGKEIIRQEYDSNLGDAEAYLQFGFVELGVANVQFEGKLDFNTWSEGDKDCTIGLVKQAFDNNIATKYETKIIITDTVDVFGNPITPPDPISIKLHSRAIVRLSSSNTTESVSMIGTAVPGSVGTRNPIYLQIDTVQVTAQQLEEFVAAPVTYLYADPVLSSSYQFRPPEAGRTRIRFQFSGIFEFNAMKLGTTAWAKARITMTPYLIIVRGGVKILNKSYPELSKVQTAGYVLDFAFPMMEQTFDLEVNDEVYWGARVTVFDPVTGAAGSYYLARTYIPNMLAFAEVRQETVAPATTCQAYRVFDVLKYMVQAITGVVNSFESAFFDEGGPGYNYAITNGFSIRNFESRLRPMAATPKLMFESLCNIFCLGIGYKNPLASPLSEYMTMEPYETFFNGAMIKKLDVISDYVETHADDITFNQAEVGYETSADDVDNNSLDDFSSKRQYLLPIKSFKATKEIKSDIISSGLVIEEQRREQFKETPTDSAANDEEIFIFNIVEGERIYPAIGFRIFDQRVSGVTVRYIEFDRELKLTTGYHFKIEGGEGHFNDGVDFTISSVLPEVVSTYVLSPTPALDYGRCRLIIELSEIECARDEDFSSVSGLLNPETAYNMRISSARMFYNWSHYLNAGLAAKSADAVIKCTEATLNKDMTSLLTTEAIARDSFAPEMIKEGGDFKLSDFQYGVRQYLPVKVEFKAPMYYSDILDLKKFLRSEEPEGTTDTPKNAGYIAHPDYNGVYWKTHITSLEYNPVKEQVTITGWKIGKL